MTRLAEVKAQLAAEHKRAELLSLALQDQHFKAPIERCGEPISESLSAKETNCGRITGTIYRPDGACPYVILQYHETHHMAQPMYWDDWQPGVHEQANATLKERLRVALYRHHEAARLAGRASA